MIDLTEDTVTEETLLKGYRAHRADGTIIQQENSTTWITVPIPANGLYTFTLKEISEQYPSLIHGDVVGFGLYQYATANMGNNTLNSTVTW